MRAYIEKLAHEGRAVELLEEKHRIEQIVYEYEMELFHILCNNERRKAEINIVEGKELINFIDHIRINIISLTK